MFVYNSCILSQRHDSALVGVARFALLYKPSWKGKKNHTQYRPFAWPRSCLVMRDVTQPFSFRMYC